MKRLLLTLLAGISALSLSAQVDSSSRAGLTDKLEEYCAALLTVPVDQQCQEVDFIIESCNDLETRREVAEWLFKHYHNSKVMGLDAVAVHIVDTWFGKGGLKMKDELSQLSASIYAQFNRQSLIGCKAPSTTLKHSDGSAFTLYDKAPGKISVLYFYAPDCAKCKVEDILLRNVIENRDAPIAVYAVCTGDDRKAWEEITSGSLDFSVSSTEVHHLWDPDGNKDWQLKYGVLQTPRMFLVDADGIIIGRSLDSYAVDRMLETLFTPVSMNYGERESMDFYDGIFASYREEHGCVTVENLMAVAEHIAGRTLREACDTMLYKQMTGDLLYYINNSYENALRRGVSDFTDKYILSRGDIWNTQDDSLKVVGLAEMMKDLADRAPLGEKLPAVSVWGRRSTKAGTYRCREWKLDKLWPKVDYVMIYHPMCSDCQDELESLKARHERGEKLRVLLVDMEKMEEEHQDAATRVMDSFDLTMFPYITKVDEQGKVTEKYSSFVK